MNASEPTEDINYGKSKERTMKCIAPKIALKVCKYLRKKPQINPFYYREKQRTITTEKDHCRGLTSDLDLGSRPL